LLALLVATVVAISESVLYIIWQARRTGKLRPPVVSSTNNTSKKVETDENQITEAAHETASASALEEKPEVRQRKVATLPSHSVVDE
jgi:hypothetical protein